MKRGEVWIVDLEPEQGSEANKVRPALIVSNDGANAAATRTQGGVVTVVPLTSNVHRVWPFQVVLPADETGLRLASKAQCEQVRAVSPQRLRARVGTVPLHRLQAVEAALRLHLGL